jgi:hypothetical protein
LQAALPAAGYFEYPACPSNVLHLTKFALFHTTSSELFLFLSSFLVVAGYNRCQDAVDAFTFVERIVTKLSAVLITSKQFSLFTNIRITTRIKTFVL